MTLAVRYLIEGWPITDIARELNVTPRQVRSYQSKVLALQSVYSESQTVANRDQLRTLEAERLNKVWAAGVVTLDTIKARVGTENERSLDDSSVARLVDGLTKTSERLSRLLGLDIPTKLVTETFSVNLKRTEERVVISFDAGVLQPPAEPIPGLSVWRGGELVEGSGDGSAAPAFESTL